jgi:hypothetical protein
VRVRDHADLWQAVPVLLPSRAADDGSRVSRQKLDGNGARVVQGEPSECPRVPSRARRTLRVVQGTMRIVLALAALLLVSGNAEARLGQFGKKKAAPTKADAVKPIKLDMEKIKAKMKEQEATGGTQAPSDEPQKEFVLELTGECLPPHASSRRSAGPLTCQRARLRRGHLRRRGFGRGGRHAGNVLRYAAVWPRAAPVVSSCRRCRTETCSPQRRGVPTARSWRPSSRTPPSCSGTRHSVTRAR